MFLAIPSTSFASRDRDGTWQISNLRGCLQSAWNRYDVRGRFGYTGCLTCGLLGTIKDGHVELALLSAWSARDTTETFIGDIRGDTLVGTYRGFGGSARFVKQR